MARQTLTERISGPLPAAVGSAPQLRRRAEGSDTMLAWERFLTGVASERVPARNFVVASWMRSREHGINPAGRSAPLVAATQMLRLRERHAVLLAAAQDIFAPAAELFAGSRSILLLTSSDGVVLHVVGDPVTIAEAEAIHLVQGGDWREGSVGTNGIGTALATARPAQVHAAEHFCEGIKAWTCAACPVFEPETGVVLGVVDVSGPPTTYQRNNLALAVAIARQIETRLAEAVAQDHARLLEVCLERLSEADARAMIALDRSGRLVHATGLVRSPVAVGQRLPGLDQSIRVEDWPGLLPEGWRPEWFRPVARDGRTIGALLVVPHKPARPGPPAAATIRSAEPGSEADPHRSSFEAIVGASPSLAATLAQARQIAGRRVPVLIEGDTGVGKELLARAIHGAEAGRPFIVYNCGATTRDLVAGDLFGHVRGAFTGATNEGRPGRLELAHGGTLCLDEIGEMPLDVQPFLLRALEEGVVYRLGDSQPRHLDVRLLALTNRDLLEEVAAGRFRRDLYYRISVTKLRAPPLRERTGDVRRLLDHFNELLAERHGLPPRVFGPEVLAVLEAYGWPGNVRELRNVVESLLLMLPRVEVTRDDVTALLLPAAMKAATPTGRVDATSLEDAEREAIRRAMHEAHGNLAEAARALGISRSTLYRKAARHGA